MNHALSPTKALSLLAATADQSVDGVITMVAKRVPIGHVPCCQGWADVYPVVDVKIQGSLALALMREPETGRIARIQSLGFEQAQELLGLGKKVVTEAAYFLPIGSGAILRCKVTGWSVETSCEQTRTTVLNLC